MWHRDIESFEIDNSDSDIIISETSDSENDNSRDSILSESSYINCSDSDSSISRATHLQIFSIFFLIKMILFIEQTVSIRFSSICA